jgi:hypothetical protein
MMTRRSQMSTLLHLQLYAIKAGCSKHCTTIRYLLHREGDACAASFGMTQRRTALTAGNQRSASSVVRCIRMGRTFEEQRHGPSCDVTVLTRPAPTLDTNEEYCSHLFERPRSGHLDDQQSAQSRGSGTTSMLTTTTTRCAASMPISQTWCTCHGLFTCSACT